MRCVQRSSSVSPPGWQGEEMNGLNAAEWVASGCCWASLVPTGARWMRVAQREHYLPGSTTRFALRWWIGVRHNVPLLLVAAAAGGLSWGFPLFALGSAVVGVTGPVGLSVRGRTSPLHVTRRLRTLAVVWLALEAGTVVLGAALGRAAFFSALAVILAPVLVDLGTLVAKPFERRLGSRFVSRARDRLRTIGPIIIGVTGSYGKTSTKNYVAHLLQGSFSVVASPASFNNRAGLARAVNEHLVPGTDVFIAEMGTYGPGEIAELCSWCPPKVAVITAIGPVHLERFGTEDAIVKAKSEIVEGAEAVVLNVDNPRLASLAEGIAARDTAPLILRCSSLDRGVDVYVGGDPNRCDVVLGGVPLEAQIPLSPGVQPTNLACALGVALALGVSPSDLALRLTGLPTVPHRLSVATASSGVIVIDDTFNSNPAGTRAALEVLRKVAESDRRVVVTPGMVELGDRQPSENERFARSAGEIASDLLVVGRTNRSALLRGAGGSLQAITVRKRDDAVRWVREHLSHGDAVLYENDLPDHYP
jgi:UDP-N-acetylmuramoyl-tripeptide--D-alanyl-D-alanine ligase